MAKYKFNVKKNAVVFRVEKKRNNKKITDKKRAFCN